MAKNKWSNTNQVMPTSTKKTHTTQRGVGGMRRRPGKFNQAQHKVSITFEKLIQTKRNIM